jgi:hypothetical protein
MIQSWLRDSDHLSELPQDGVTASVATVTAFSDVQRPGESWKIGSMISRLSPHSLPRSGFLNLRSSVLERNREDMGYV